MTGNDGGAHDPGLLHDQIVKVHANLDGVNRGGCQKADLPAGDEKNDDNQICCIRDGGDFCRLVEGKERQASPLVLHHPSPGDGFDLRAFYLFNALDKTERNGKLLARGAVEKKQ